MVAGSLPPGSEIPPDKSHFLTCHFPGEVRVHLKNLTFSLLTSRGKVEIEANRWLEIEVYSERDPER